MPKFHVHLYRAMRLYYPDIDAESPEAAARIAAEKTTDEADNIIDCEGDNLSALIDFDGDKDFARSRLIGFQPSGEARPCN